MGYNQARNDRGRMAGGQFGNQIAATFSTGHPSNMQQDPKGRR